MLLARFSAFLYMLRTRFRTYGWSWLLRGVARIFGSELLWMILLPAGLIGHLLGYRRLIVRTEHIGHLAAEVDTFLKELRLGRMPARRWFLTAPSNRVANQHLLGYWRELVPVYSNRQATLLLELLSRRWWMREDLSRYVGGYFGSQDIYRINRLWDRRPPTLILRPKDEAWAKPMLDELGIKADRWFACVHVREGGFLPLNESIQSHRNANVAMTIPAMKEIVRRGGICVRLGDPSMTPLPPIPGVIDYAHHPLKSARLDVVLCAKARLFLGCTSGLSLLGSAFGVPVAHANMIPAGTLGVRCCDLSIPKLLWSESHERYLSFEEIFSSPVGGYFFSHQYEKARVRPVENSADDILDLAVEALNRLDEAFIESEDDQMLHSRYMALIKPGHYSHRACSRIGLGFLRRHRSLFSTGTPLHD